MSEPQQPADKTAEPRPQKVLADFVETLHRIIKIGTYYPQGHAALDRAAHLFQHGLQKIAEDRKSAGIELKGTSLVVEGQEITLISPALTEVKTLFRDLGIGRLEIDRAVPLKDLLQLIRTLLQHRSQLQGVKQFTKAKLVDIPATIRVFQQEFLVDQAAILRGDSDDDSGQGLDAVFLAMEEQGLSHQQISQCRTFLHSLAQKFTAQPIRLKGLPAISWNDVRKLLTKIAGSGFQFSEGSAKGVSHNDLNALSAIFDGLRQELDDQESRETISLLVSAFNQGQLARKSAATNDRSGKGGLRAKDKGTDLTIGEIQTFVRDQDAPENRAITIRQVDRSDELAILLQMMQFPQEKETSEGLQRGLRDILAVSLSPRMVGVLIKGLLHLSEIARGERLEEAVAFVSRQLRGSATFSSLAFLVMLCRRLQPEELEQLWTTVINELLAVGRTAEAGPVFAELARLAASIPSQAMRNQSLQLEGIDAIKERKIASDIFDPEIKAAYPIYAILLETSLRTPIASRVLGGLRATPPDWLIAALAPLLDPSQPRHLQFLHAYLHVAHQQRFPLTLQITAGKLVVELLPGLEEATRSEPWVATTIAAASQLHVQGTRQLLERVISEKKMVVVAKWPSPCRQAASLALQRLKQKPLG